MTMTIEKLGLHKANGYKLTKMAAFLGAQRHAGESDEALRQRAVDTFNTAHPPGARAKQLQSAIIACLFGVAAMSFAYFVGASLGWAIAIGFVSLAGCLHAANQYNANEAALDTAELMKDSRTNRLPN